VVRMAGLPTHSFLYAAIWFTARMEMARRKAHLVPGIIAAVAIWIAAAADVAEDLGELFPGRFPHVMHSASLWKWGYSESCC